MKEGAVGLVFLAIVILSIAHRDQVNCGVGVQGGL